ncbi:MAG: 2-oxo acid dehydrogenase subunit E2 [Dermatophilaceae bacterium]
MQNAPHFYLTTQVRADALLRFRAELNEQLASAGAPKVSINDLVVKACATAIAANPAVNVSFAEDKLLRYKRVNIGVAVALETGLIVPVVKDADRISLTQLAAETRRLVDKARAGKLAPDEFTGGTFTVTNLGMYGIDHFTAVINPPEAAILAVGATSPQAVVDHGELSVAQTMKLTLAIDHRALDGATAAQFLQQLKNLLEEPLRILA